MHELPPHSSFVTVPTLRNLADGDRVHAPRPAVSPEEATLLSHWEQGPVRGRPAKRFHELFEALADRHPHRPAVVTQGGVQSYEELEHMANRIARNFLNHSVAPEEPIAVLTGCSFYLPATVLGIWKAGATYLPLALELPPDRLAYLVRDSGAKTLFVLDGYAVPPLLAQAVSTIMRPEISEWNAPFPPAEQERPEIAGTPQDLAYIIYTSGTTGMPKGVLIQHDSLINSAYMTGEAVGLTSEDRISLVSNPGFDASLWELGMGLLHGMAVMPVSQMLRDDPWALNQWYKTSGVTVAFHAPSYLHVCKQMHFEGLRILLTGGEAPNHDDAKRYADHLAFWNAYGPTEAGILVCAERLSAQPAPDRPLPAGRPLSNTRISIRRDNGAQAAPLEVGEIWLGGVGLARGYLNNPELTASRFVETRDGRFYRTGDIGGWTEDGRLEVLGRIDQQLKLQGQRVELGEIEQALRSHPAVDEAVILVESTANDAKALRAFVLLRSSAAEPTEDEWRAYLGDRLPQYMIPASVTSVAAFPLTFAGKIDREALLLSQSVRRAEAVKSPARDEMEMKIGALWGDMLGTEVSSGDNFFALGGNSLLAITMAHRLSLEMARPIPARELFAAPTLAGFAKRMTELLRAANNAKTRAFVGGSDLATEGQREFWTSEAAGLDTRTFTIPVLRVVEGEMPPLDRWNEAWAVLVARHESLRTYFREDAEARLRRGTPSAMMPTLEAATCPDRSSARAFARQRQGETFAMGTPPLWRAGLIEVEDSGEHLFWLALHHSVGDGRSIGIITEELGALLRGEKLPGLVSKFAESAAREETYLSGPDCPKDSLYWHDLLAQLPESAFDEGALDFPRSLTSKTGNHRFETRLSTDTTQGLKTIARHHNASLHTVLLTLLAMETRRRQGRSDFVIATTTSLRETAAEEDVVGYYVNMLPIPCHLPRNISFGAALRQTQQGLAASLQHARYPFARIYHDFWKARPQHHQPSRYPVFDLAVTENPEVHLSPASLRLARFSELKGADAEIVAYELTDASPGQDMVLTHECLSDCGLLLQWHVNAAVYSQETASNWFESLRGWAVWLAENPMRVQDALPALLPSEAELLEGFEQGTKADRPALRFHELFERVIDNSVDQVARPAVVTQASTTTYDALEREANAIAHALLLRGATATPGMVVGVLTERSANLPATVLGIWKAGAIYLPLAADLPQERLAFMANDAGIEILIALDGLAVSSALPTPFRPEEMDADFRRVHEHRPLAASGASDAAYIIYTSGSTGKPKGTLIDHQAYVNSLLGTGETLGLTCDDRSLMFASPSFDVSLSDIGLPLAFGAAMCPVSYEVLSSPNRFRVLLSELNITVADVTPTYLRLFDKAELPSLRVLVTGGEAPFPADVETYAGRLQYFNCYGPTENTITSTIGRLYPGDKGVISCGRPLPNTSVRVCTSWGTPVPPGVVGELWLGGVGLARGYLGRPELTAASFIETERGRYYRSGDLGRWRATGEIEILGRADDQVKLNGIRVELGEIEHALGCHIAVAQAVALLTGDSGNHSLWAFVRLMPGSDVPTEESWRDFLAEHLPAYMIPSVVIVVPEIPLSSSGKVDKSALKALLGRRSAQSEVPLPQDDLEVEIARVWGDLLSNDSPIHRDDNFFMLGGHSLLAIAVVHRLEETLGYPIPARELFAEPTLRGFACRVGQLGKAAIPASVFSDRATEGQFEFWVAQKADLDVRGFTIPLTLATHGSIPSDSQWRDAWSALVIRHDALRTRFYEDHSGVLRRSMLPEVGESLQISTQPDMPTALAYVRETQQLAFVMEEPPLWCAGLVHVADSEQCIFWLALHHSVGDGVSLGVLTEELLALLQGETMLPATGCFDQSAGQEESYLASPARKADAEYWRKVLGGLGDNSPDTPRPFDEWPLDFPRTFARTARNAKGAHCFRVRLDSSVAIGLRDLSQRNGASLHSLMLTIMAHEVNRRTGRSKFLLGTAASTRNSVGEARIVGYYVNMLPVCCHVQGRESFERSLRTLHRTLSEGLQHARYPFARIYRDFRHDHGLTPHPSRYPLFDLAVTENPGISGSKINNENGFHFSGIAAMKSEGPSYELRLNAPAQDMVLIHESEPDGSLVLQWYVNAAIYEKETADAWINSLSEWARYLAAGKRLPEFPLPALLPTEEKLLVGWEHGPTLPSPTLSFPAMFEHWVQIQPESPALITEQGLQSYAALNARSNALAHALLAEGVARHERVGVFTDRSMSLPETVLSIWKAGGCYVPMVTDQPPDRLAFIARDAGIRVLVVLDGHEVPSSLTELGCKILRPEHVPHAFFRSHSQPPKIGGIEGSDLAYIIYTSGTTGVPKGVMLFHRGLNNFGMGVVAALNIHSHDRVLLMASPAFDAWISDLAMAWTAGAALVPVLRSEMDDIAGMRDKIARLGVSTATMTPSYLRLFAQADFPGLRLLMTVGESPNRADALYYAARLRYINGYGPTENTVAVSFGQITTGAQRLTVGRPLANTSVHIRNSDGESVPPGAEGIIWVGGAGLAAGYLNRSDLTADSFVETPDGLLYCTGDLGRWTHSGELQVLGRSDRQVKLHGHRVELGEIEHRLGTHPAVIQGVAELETQADGTPTLWAFVCFRPGATEPTQTQWHDYLSKALPQYMLPSAVLKVSVIPVNIAGKVDRAALLRLASERRANCTDADGDLLRDLPRDGTEHSVAQVWADRLERRFIAREDNFFNLGGNSLRAISVVNQLRRTFHCTINDLYEHPGLADFASTCRPRPGHLRGLIQSATRHWQSYRNNLAVYDSERDAALTAAQHVYEKRNRFYERTLGGRRDYDRVLLTGSTGYLGCYLLRELLADQNRHVSVLVRGNNNSTARARLGKVLSYYFGAAKGAALRDSSRLTVLAGDLRLDDMGLSSQTYSRLADSLQAVFHSAANVKHFGHYEEFHSDNVAATRRLLKLAAHHSSNPVDFHFVSTLSACGNAPEDGFRLFTEYDAVPDVLDENYYIRTKQEAERLVVASRQYLANACIHRVGNLVFAADGGPLQINIKENAFFRQLAAFIRLGVVPDDSHLWLCHVDVVARGLLRLAETNLTNETHHLENVRRETLATFIKVGVRPCGFDGFMERLEAAADDPDMNAALTETLENFKLYGGVSPQGRARRLEIVSGRTQSLLGRLGVVWPPIPSAGRMEMLREAAEFFSRPSLSNVA